MSAIFFSESKHFERNAYFHQLAHQHGTPLYVYNLDILIKNIEVLKNSLKRAPISIHYAVKANSNTAILKVIGKSGLGTDIVSGGELRKCIEAGISSHRIIFSGVGKTTSELSYAIAKRIGRINVESFSELKELQQLYAESSSNEKKYFPKISLRINPKIKSRTHPYIATALGSSKFGFDDFELNHCLHWYRSLQKAIPVSGLSAHIGSQLTDLTLYQESLSKLVRLADSLPFDINHIDLGGGLGIGPDKSVPSLKEYGLFLKRIVKPFIKKYTFSIEPGRSLVGVAGVLLTRIVRKKVRRRKSIYILDAGMNDLIRPALYGAVHPLEILDQTAQDNRQTEFNHSQSEIPNDFTETISDFAGPVCESSDYFLKNIPCRSLKEGTLISIQNAGAYGYTMASEYNTRQKPKEMLYWYCSSSKGYKGNPTNKPLKKDL